PPMPPCLGLAQRVQFQPPKIVLVDSVTLYFWLFIALTLSLVVAIFVRPARVFEYPYFMGATFAAFICPQAYALFGHADYWPEDALEATFLMCLLILGACWMGYQVQPNP